MADPGRSPSRDRANGEEEKRRRSPDEPPRPDGDFKIFVGGISWHMNDRELKDTFRAFNAKTATVMLDKMTHRSRGFGFVTFDTEQDLLAAIKEMHDSELEGRKISCNRAIPQSETAPGTPASALADGTGPGRSARLAGGTFQRGRADTYERGGAAAYAAPYERGAYAAPRGGAYDGRRDAYDRGGYGAAPARGGYGDYDRYGGGRGDFDRFGDRGGFGAQYGGAGGYDRPDPYYPPRDPGYPPRDPYADRGYGGYETGGYDRGGYGSSFASPAGGYDRGYDDRYARGPPPMRDAYRRPDPYAAPGRSR